MEHWMINHEMEKLEELGFPICFSKKPKDCSLLTLHCWRNIIAIQQKSIGRLTCELFLLIYLAGPTVYQPTSCRNIMVISP